jgi:hypothetical protein
MHCPYCTSDINDAALVCPICSRDLYLFKPLLQRLSEFEKTVEANGAEKIQALESRVKELEEELALLRQSGPKSAQMGLAAGEVEPRNFIVSAVIACVVVLGLLLTAHALIVIVFDLRPIYLRIASLLIPLPFGFAIYVWHPKRGLAAAILAALVACASVLGMSAVTGYVDNTPVLPQNLREWREFIEYAASIGFSFVTGTLLGKFRYHRRHVDPEPSRLVVFLAQLFAADESGQLGLQKMAARITQIGAAVAPAASAVASVYAGIKAVIGDS